MKICDKSMGTWNTVWFNCKIFLLILNISFINNKYSSYTDMSNKKTEKNQNFRIKSKSIISHFANENMVGSI